MMPVEAFPTRIRSTAQGISAAVGKLGAITGAMGLLAMWYSYCTLSLDSTGAPNCTVTFTTAAQQSQSDNGVVAIMALCAGISLMGNVMTTIFLKETGGKTLEQVDDECVTLKAFAAADEAAAAAAGLPPMASPTSVGSPAATETEAASFPVAAA